MNGTYSMVYGGSEGVGLGIFTLTNSQLVGCALAGGRFRGTVAETATGEFDFDLEQTVPPGVALVQGTSAQELPYTKRITGKLPADFANGKPISLYLPPGDVTVMIVRVTDDWAPYARGLNATITPQT
jgi:hypothetical protein